MKVAWGVALVALAGCAESSDALLNTDAVRDAASAIRIAERSCGPYPTVGVKAEWRAYLRDGIWEARLRAADDDSKATPILQVNISARTGEPLGGGCMIFAG